ncbi:hypothetical protein K491DRAFT_673792 [Lophiostoma macrostomum CBS 122681]|uniref:BTB domain-containing protein n=1 Tax=Lophiostoma macrostomum CBS 122681 TaxID=1314788 RepID=A0A6A6TPV5_9PLEO|nr:hypothetical protein K491DRAFT_673792 [Lophiostoma macrostomum CBS 122681]
MFTTPVKDPRVSEDNANTSFRGRAIEILARGEYFHVAEEQIKGRSKLFDDMINRQTREPITLDHDPDIVQLYVNLMNDNIIPVIDSASSGTSEEFHKLMHLLLLTEKLNDVMARNITTAGIVAFLQTNPDNAFIYSTTIRRIYDCTNAGNICREIVIHVVREFGSSSWYGTCAFSLGSVPAAFFQDLSIAFMELRDHETSHTLRTCPLNYYYTEAEGNQK